MLTTVVEPTRADRDMRAPQLKGRVVLIAGGTEGVGVQSVRAFLQRGAVVVVPSASAEQPERSVRTFTPSRAKMW